MSNKAMSRRLLLRGIPGAAFSLPLLHSLGCDGRSGDLVPGANIVATERALTSPTRFIVFFTPNGVSQEDFWPSGTGSSYTMSKTLSPFDGAGPSDAHHFNTGAVRGDVNIIKGIENPAGPVGAGSAHIPYSNSTLTGVPTVGSSPPGAGISIDQAVAQAVGGATVHRIVRFGVRANWENSDGAYNFISYAGANQGLQKYNNPHQTFDLLFAGGAVPGQANDPTKPAIDPAVRAARLERRSILDFVRGDFGKLQNRLGLEDREKLQSHIEGIREIERKLELAEQANEVVVGDGCSLPRQAPASENSTCGNSKLDGCWALQEERFSEVGKLQMDIMVKALACDLTRVATLMWTTSNAKLRFSWLGHSENHHDLSHAVNNAGPREQIRQIDTYYADKFAYLINQLRGIPEGDGTMLDNTVLLWINEHGNGRDHDHVNLPIVVGGRGSGAITPGRFLDLPGRSTNDLFVTLARAAGANFNTFGSANFNTGPIAELA